MKRSGAQSVGIKFKIEDDITERYLTKNDTKFDIGVG